jgi:hypothetical protein
MRGVAREHGRERRRSDVGTLELTDGVVAPAVRARPEEA